MTPPEPAPPDQFTLEEWVEATQACCGICTPDDEDASQPEPAEESP